MVRSPEEEEDDESELGEESDEDSEVSPHKRAFY